MRNIERIRKICSSLIWVVLVLGIVLPSSCSKSDGDDSASLILTADKTAFEDYGGSLVFTIQADKDCPISMSGITTGG